jgi:hypothetical protein
VVVANEKPARLDELTPPRELAEAPTMALAAATTTPQTRATGNCHLGATTRVVLAPFTIRSQVMSTAAPVTALAFAPEPDKVMVAAPALTVAEPDARLALLESLSVTEMVLVLHEVLIPDTATDVVW